MANPVYQETPTIVRKHLAIAARTPSREIWIAWDPKYIIDQNIMRNR